MCPLPARKQRRLRDLRNLIQHNRSAKKNKVNKYNLKVTWGKHKSKVSILHRSAFSILIETVFKNIKF